MSDSFPQHGGNIVWAKKHYNRNDLIDFSANINPLGCPSSVFEALSSSWQRLLHYPDPFNTELKHELQRYYSLGQEYVIIGNGAAEIIYLICSWLRPKKILTLAPTFSEYARAAKAVKAEISYFPLYNGEDFSLDLELLDQMLIGIDLFFLCNPNNPVGSILDYATMQLIQELCYKHGTFLVVDESFIDFVPKKEEYSVRKNVQNNNRLLVLHSLTKFFAIPGLRLGCGLGNPELIKELDKLKEPWNINVFAQIAGKAALEDKLFPLESIKYILREKDFLYNSLTKLSGYHVFPSAANFFLLKLRAEGLTSSLLTEILAQKGILVRNCNTFPTLDEHFIRIAVRTREENLKLLMALKEI